MKSDCILVVGAGPVGLVAATYLADEGIPVTIVESAKDLPQDLRASTFHPPTLDMLDRFGVAARCVEEGLICPHWQFRDRKEGVVATFDLGMLKDETRHPYRLQCEQWRLSRMLRDRLAANPDVRFLYGAKAQALAQDADGVRLNVEHEDGSREELDGRFLIGADGLRSVVRQSIGVEFEGQTIPEIFLTVSTTFRFDQAIPDLANIAYISDPDEWVVLLRTASLWRVLVPTDPTLSDREVTDPERTERRLQAIVPKGEPYDVRHRTAYRVHEKVAQRYRVGRVFLAGDAAHVNNPLGGMGMNGGIHDAFNLAEKIVKVWRGAPVETLDRYERQRRKVALDVVQQTTLRNRSILNSKDPAARAAYYEELRRTAEDPGKHKAYVLRTSMIQSLRDLEEVA
jgi:3-(3-hydroxy-phenyl)propionate hydroxylase